MPYMAAVEEAGLRDIFEPETVPALSETLEEYLDGRPISYGEQQGGTAGRFEEILLILCFVLVALGAVLRLRRAQRQRAERRRDANDPWPSQERRETFRRSGPDPWSGQDKKPPWEL